MKICVLAQDESFLSEAERLANYLSCFFLTESFCAEQWKKELKRLKSTLIDFQALLLVQETGLSLLPLVQGMSPVYIDFTSTAWKRRLFNVSIKKELAAKALGLHKKAVGTHKKALANDRKEAKIILDANAGLGQDSFVFAALGAQVIAYERSPLVYCLLNDALKRAKYHNDIAAIAERITLSHADSINQLKTINLNCSAIYLDPMFPEKKNQALAKKEMQVLQSFVGSDDDAEDLLEVALNHLSQGSLCTRVVLKRPKSAVVLRADRLGAQLLGKAMRFDSYFK